MLTLIATPIGNLSDLSERALLALSEATHVLCEDTRVTEKLYRMLEERLKLLSAPRRYISYHKFNETEKLSDIIDSLLSGQNMVLVSDAGTPAISDPGQKLVQACHENNIPVSIIPGPCAFISAFAVSGFYADRVQFIGFLPKSRDEKKVVLRECLQYQGASCAYESPERIYDTLSILKELEPGRTLALIRELTKKFEEITVASAEDIEEKLQARHQHAPLKGEITLVLNSPGKTDGTAVLSEDDFRQKVFSAKKAHNVSLSEACQLVAKAHGVKRKWLYSICLETSQDF